MIKIHYYIRDDFLIREKTKGRYIMNTTLKILSLILALAICVTAFASCGNGKGETTTEAPSGEITEGKADATTEKKEETTSAPTATDERFDYFNTDLSKYITVNPEIYKNLTLEIEERYKVTDELLEKYIAEVVGNYPNISKVTDREIAKGDTVYIFYEGFIDGVAFNGGSNMSDAEPYPLTIGSGSFIPGFEDGLIGVIPANTSREAPAEVLTKFPDDYHSADVAGKEAIFKVVVEYIAEETPAEFGEEFVLKNFNFDPADGDVVEQFKALALEDLQTSFRSVALNAAYEALVGKFTVNEYPQSELDYYFDYYNSQFESYYNSYLSQKSYYEAMGLIFDDYDSFVCYNVGIKDGEDWQAVVTEQCKLYVEKALILFGIAQAEEFVVDEDRYAASLDYLTKYYILYYENAYGYTFAEEQIQSMISSDMVIEHATTELFLDLILEHATINYIPTVESN